jgi:hypothetical protein
LAVKAKRRDCDKKYKKFSQNLKKTQEGKDDEVMDIEKIEEMARRHSVLGGQANFA